jgi:uncharacterized membrane protein YesL
VQKGGFKLSVFLPAFLITFGPSTIIAIIIQLLLTKKTGVLYIDSFPRVLSIMSAIASFFLCIILGFPIYIIIFAPPIIYFGMYSELKREFNKVKERGKKF